MMKSARIFNGSGWSSRLAGSSMPYLVEIVRSASAMMGKSMVMPFSQWATTTLSQVLCESMGSTDSVATLTLRCVNHSYLSARRPICHDFGRANRRGVSRVRKEHTPAVADPLVEGGPVALRRAQGESGTMLPRRIGALLGIEHGVGVAARGYTAAALVRVLAHDFFCTKS